MQDFEKLGVFYLGKAYDIGAGKLRDDLILYDSKDLVTHALCIGMTGSGKTGLCLSLLEEALLDGLPALIVDPKGDLTNLALTFPELRPQDFAPWVNEEDARRRGVSVDELAKQQAETWRRGLADWGQDGERIRRLRDSAEIAIYTPGSNSGAPLAVLKSFAAPPAALLADADLLSDRVGATATSLLALLGIDADPLRSREHILLSNILGAAWTHGRGLDLVALIQEIQTPPFKKVGAFDVDTFFPAQDRFALAMQLNNLLASPGFEVWTQGDPLDVAGLLYTPQGKPRAAILSIAHLNDAERMFFVSLLLNETLAWMRTQSGTTSLRAILYMDEIFGYFPPVANPPSKQPLLTLLKQARAFGLGVVLATQNPVDLDYKGLANIGTWFIGRLQTERDKARVMEGLEGAAAGGSFDRGRMEEVLAGLGNRIFLMNNVHEDAPVVFHARWAMSYLRGPLTREQFKKLEAEPTTTAAAGASTSVAPTPTASSVATTRPALSPQIEQYFLPPKAQAAVGTQLVYHCMLLGSASIYLADAKLGVEATEHATLLAPIDEKAVAVDWGEGIAAQQPLDALEKSPVASAAFAEVPAAATDTKNYKRWQSDLQRWLQTNHRLELRRSPLSKLVSRPGESERDFRVRLRDGAHESRDENVEALRQKYAKKLAAIADRVQRAEQTVSREEAQVSQQNVQTAISLGATILGAFLGRKAIRAGTLGSAASTARGASRVLKERGDAQRARETLDELKAEQQQLEADLERDLAELGKSSDPSREILETVTLKPKKADVNVRLVALAWVPYWVDAAGNRERAWV